MKLRTNASKRARRRRHVKRWAYGYDRVRARDALAMMHPRRFAVVDGSVPGRGIPPMYIARAHAEHVSRWRWTPHAPDAHRFTREEADAFAASYTHATLDVVDLGIT